MAVRQLSVFLENRTAGDTPEALQRRVMEQAEWILLPRAAEMVAQELEEKR